MTAKSLLMTATALCLTAGAAVSQSDAASEPIQCGQDYTVARGDTLSLIAERAYNNSRSFQLIYNANSDVIGSNPGIIEVGARFFIPCLDGAVAPSTADASVIRTEPTVEEVVPAEEQVISIVTGTGWAPFQNEDQEQGGMLTEILNVALSKVADQDGYKIDFINDYNAHLQPLISDLHYDLSSAWFRPNCDKIDLLGADSQFRCNNLDWSDPIYEQVIGFYTRSGEAQPLTYDDMFGKTICRPKGYATFMMEEHGLVEPNITLARADNAFDCFEGLADGSYDMAILAIEAAEGNIAQLGAEDQIVRNDVLDTVATLNVVTSKNHPNGEAILAMVNEGIADIQNSGEWFEIVRRHLAEHRSR